MILDDADIVIEKCILYVGTVEKAPVHSGVEVTGRNRMAVTLPKLKCLQDEKYRPYVEVCEQKEEPNDPLFGKELTDRQRKTHEMFKLGKTITEIAKELNVSVGSIHSNLTLAKVKLGEIKQYKKYSKRRIPQTKENLRNQPLSENEQRVYDLFLRGMDKEQIAQAIGKEKKRVSEFLRKAQMKKGVYENGR
jgi:DNA-binding NarL/FixJ family response regulator